MAQFRSLCSPSTTTPFSLLQPLTLSSSLSLLPALSLSSHSILRSSRLHYIPCSEMAQLRSLYFPSTPTFSLLEPPSLSSLSLLPTLSLSSRKFTSSSFLRNTHRLNPILCSSSTLITENPPSESKEEEIIPTRLLAQNVPWTSTADDIRALFEKHGKVVDVQLSMHNKSRNRGLAFVEMGSVEEAAEALSKLENYEYEGRTLKLNYARKQKKKASPVVQPKPPVVYNLFVANLSFEARDKHVKELFESGGYNVVSAEVIYHDNPRRPAGYGFVSFKTKKEADEALSTFEGKELMGRPIRVARSNRFVKLETEVNSQSEEEQDKSIDTSGDSGQPETVGNL